MDNDQLRSSMTDTFRDVFDDSNLVISDSMTAGDVEGWDSLSYMNLIVSLERKFKIKFTTGEVSKLKNVGELVSLIQSKTA